MSKVRAYYEDLKMEPYRVRTDPWGRRWQAEPSEYGLFNINWQWCPRAYTRRGVMRKAKRWFYHGTDWGKHRRRYYPQKGDGND